MEPTAAANFATRHAKFFAYFFLVFGAINLADWIYASPGDLHNALMGIGFLLMSVGPFADAYPGCAASLRGNGLVRLPRLLQWTGVLVAAAGYAVDWL